MFNFIMFLNLYIPLILFNIQLILFNLIIVLIIFSNFTFNFYYILFTEGA